MTDHELDNQGHFAAEVIANQAYQAGIESLKKQVTVQLLACPMTDRDQQVLLIQLAKLTDKFDSILRGFIEAGKLAQHNIKIDKLRNESTARSMMRWVL